MNYDKILAALESRLASIEGVPAIAYENVNYSPTVGTPFLRTRFVPIDRRTPFYGQMPNGKPFMQRYVGLFQVVLNYPEGQGQKPTNTMANLICDRFEATTDIQFQDIAITINRTERMRGFPESPWFKTPVNIHWTCFTN